MPPDSTCWTIILGAADGEPEQRAAFVHLYVPVIRAYLLARWLSVPRFVPSRDRRV